MTAKYDPKICETLPQMFANGETIVEVAKALGISRRAFYDWKLQHPEFAEALDEGLAYSEAWWSKLGRAGAIGAKPVNPALWIFNMKNRFKWADRTDVGLSGPGGGAIKTESRVVTSEMTTEELASVYRESVKNTIPDN